MRRLILRPGAIGDCIVSIPAMESLRADFTEVWVPEQNIPLIQFAGRVRCLASSRIDLLELGLAPEALRRELAGFDDIVSWYGANRPEFQEAVRGLPFRFFPALPDQPGKHAVDFYLDQLDLPAGAAPRLHFDGPHHGAAAIHPYSGSPSKNWPWERYLELSRRIPEAEFCETEQGHRFPGLGELGIWLAGSRVFVGNDSGITHLAASLGIPTIALFGHTNPAVWAPRGERVHVIHNRRMEEITVEEVATAVVDFTR